MRASKKLALSFRKMPDDLTHNIKVVLPLLRSEVKRLKASNGNYIHGYMVNAGFGENIFDWYKNNPQVPLIFFWDKKGAEIETMIDSTLSFHQIDDLTH